MEIIVENKVADSDDENEMNMLNTVKVRNKLKVLDSDSEDENREPSENESNFSQEVQLSHEKSKILDSDSKIENNNLPQEVPREEKKLKRISVVDSDSDEETVPHNTNKTHSDIIDEELEEEEEIAPHNKSFPDEETAVEAVIYTTNSKGELIQENNTTVTYKKSSLSKLCDSESEDENERNIIEATPEPEVRPMVYKRPRKKKKDDKPKLMTAQEAAKQRTEIQSESQRMLRDSNISLPYHKPKSYTIREFLEKRSKLPSARPLIPKAPPPIAIKMSKDQLKEVSKKLDERIKEVEEFYKSESDEDENEDDPSVEIRGWLNMLVDDAVNTVETRENDAVMEELSEENEAKQHESMEYEFNLDDVNEVDIAKKPPITELIKDKLGIQPKLLGTPDDIIDLEEGVTKPSAVKQLVEKFLQHTAKKNPHKHTVELDIMEVGTNGQIVKETVSMNLEEDEEPAMFETPGAKLQKLREDLQVQMAQRRLKLWKEKHEQGDTLITENKTESEKTEGEKDILDDEDEEFEMTESESEDEEVEEELKPEKPKPKSAFVDDEADEDEDMKEDYEEDVNEDEEEIIDCGGDVSEEEGDNEGFEGDVEEAPEELESPKKKTLKRIVKPFTEDSDEEEEASQESEPTKVLKYYTTDEDDIIPPNLPRVGNTPQRTQTEKSSSEFDFLTPVTYLTGLQNLNTDARFSKDSPKSPYVPSLSSEDSSSQTHIQKNLFPENSQTDFEDLVGLCSGKFSETQVEEPEETGEETEPTTQDLLNVCSGDFSTLVSSGTNEVSKVVTNVETNPENETKSLDDENDQIISQLLDEDELERFKKKFESPVNTVRRSQVLEEVEEVHATGLINSDDENEELEVKTKKKQKKLVFSDDEAEEKEEMDDDSDDEEQEVEDEEAIDLHDSEDEEQQLEKQILAEESGNYKSTDFLDAEAELSESEWGSADEDEKDLDQLEFEAGDEEKFNEKKMRSELERIHMRQLLDEDNREVKILQELLLEDGEMHGTGRKRQFRWKTLDSTDNGEFEKRDDDDIFLDEEENEEEWRKMRHKREMFLKKKSTATEDDDDDDSILGNSQILKLGQQIFKNKSFSSQNNTPIDKTDKTDDIKEPFSLLNKRGSFLSRNDQVLQRLAEYTKVTTTIGSTAAKNSKSFVFQSVQVNETEIIKDNNNKRKATDGTPNVIKKVRLDDLSPAVSKKQTGKSSRAKKLFGNW